MRLPSKPSYINRGFLIIVSILVLSVIATLGYLIVVLTQLNHLITQNAADVASATRLESFSSTLDMACSSAGRYVQSGQNADLTAYTKAADRMPMLLRNIQKADRRPALAQVASKLQQLSAPEIAQLETAVQARSSGDIDKAVAALDQAHAVTQSEAVREETSEQSQQILVSVAPRQRQSRNVVNHAVMVGICIGLFTLLTCVVLLLYFQRAILEERALETTKSEFLSLASHQLRTPATNVKQYLALVMDGYLGDVNQQQRDALEVAYKNNESEIRIMNDLLDVAKLSLNRTQIQKTSVDLVYLAAQVVHQLRPAAAEKLQTIRLFGPPTLQVPIDRPYIKGVIENLIDNSIRYSKQKTAIAIHIRRSDQNWVELSVRDRGYGIMRKDLPKLFKKFSRLDNETSATTQGSGMGLYWVKQIVTMHGGNVRAEARPGGGSIFTVRLPLQ